MRAPGDSQRKVRFLPESRRRTYRFTCIAGQQPRSIYSSDNAKIRQSHFSPRSVKSGMRAGKAKRERLWIDAVQKNKTRRGARMKNLIGMLVVLLLASAFVVAQSQDTSGSSSQSAGQTSDQGSSASSQSSPSSAGQSSSSTSSTDQSSTSPTDHSGKKAKKHHKKKSSDSSMSTSSSDTSSSGSGSTDSSTTGTGSSSTGSSSTSPSGSSSGSSTQTPPSNPPQQ
jgi:hypothetical protein